MMLSCVLALGLSACGKSDSSGEAENKTAVPASETADYVRSAKDAADHLYGSYLLAEDGSIITLRDTSYQNAALGYASLKGVRKLCVSPSESYPFALTEGGDLYAAGSAADVSCIPVCAGRNGLPEPGRRRMDDGRMEPRNAAAKTPRRSLCAARAPFPVAPHCVKD